MGLGPVCDVAVRVVHAYRLHGLPAKECVVSYERRDFSVTKVEVDGSVLQKVSAMVRHRSK